jgi:hypothetical protein
MLHDVERLVRYAERAANCRPESGAELQKGCAISSRHFRIPSVGAVYDRARSLIDTNSG